MKRFKKSPLTDWTLVVDGSPAVGPSNDSSSSKSAHSRKRKVDRPTHFSITNVSRVYSSILSKKEKITHSKKSHKITLCPKSRNSPGILFSGLRKNLKKINFIRGKNKVGLK